MTDPEDLDLATLLVGGGNAIGESPGRSGVVEPISLSTTYHLDTAGYPDDGHYYGRLGNPSRETLEARLAAASAAAGVRATASGMAAISATCLTLLEPGDRLLAGRSLYGGTRTFFDRFLGNFGVEVAYVDAADPAAVAAKMDDSTTLLWVESPTNPLLELADIDALADIAGDAGAQLAVDNTFATPYAQRPLELGADVSVYSTTKFVNGHSDSVGGAIAVADQELLEDIEYVVEELLGSQLAPFDCFLVSRGLKTLPARMDRHERTATRVAEFLAGHDAVASVNYPGVPDHPQHDLARRQMENFGGMISVEVDGDSAETRAVVEDLSVCNLGMSLGGVETLVEHSASTSAAGLSSSERAEAGVSDSLVRLSVGLESPDDLIDDLESSLAHL